VICEIEYNYLLSKLVDIEHNLTMAKMCTELTGNVVGDIQ